MSNMPSISLRRLILACLLAAAAPLQAAQTLPLVTSADLAGDKYLNKRVRFEGRVTEQFHDEANPDYYFLTLEDDYGIVYLSAKINKWPSLATNDYVGCRVSILGSNQMTVTKPRGTRQYLFHELQYDVLRRDATVIDAPREDPFDVPELEPTLSVAPEKSSSLGNRKLTGRVLAVRSPDEILMLTPSNTISRVTLRGVAPPQAGDFIEAVGPVETDTYFLNLTRARWRKAHPFQTIAPAPKDMTARQIVMRDDGQLMFKVKLHGQPIRIRSIVRSLPDPKFGNRMIFAESDGVTFPIDASSCPAILEKLKRGSTIDATGICWMGIDNWRPTAVFPQVKGFTLVPRSPDDVAVVAHPPWWTPARLMGVIGTLLVVLLASVVWNRALSHAARRRGQQLFREQLARVTAELKTAERSRLAVELHDSISQVLTGVALKIKAAQTMARSDIDKSLQNLAIAESTLRSSREELRHCLWDLRNNILDIPDFEEAVRQMLKPLTGDAELAVRFPVPRRKFPDKTAHAILQIIRELAVNAIRHGKATKIRIAGALENGTLSFSVGDNGSGFDQSSAPGPEQGHFGIQGIQDRLAHYNGTFAIHGAPGEGAKAVVSMQIKQEQTEGIQ